VDAAGALLAGNGNATLQGNGFGRRAEKSPRSQSCNPPRTVFLGGGWGGGGGGGVGGGDFFWGGGGGVWVEVGVAGGGGGADRDNSDTGQRGDGEMSQCRTPSRIIGERSTDRGRAQPERTSVFTRGRAVTTNGEYVLSAS